MEGIVDAEQHKGKRYELKGYRSFFRAGEVRSDVMGDHIEKEPSDDHDEIPADHRDREPERDPPIERESMKDEVRSNLSAAIEERSQLRSSVGYPGNVSSSRS